MNIEECKNHYLGLKNIKNSIEKIEPEFFFEFAETVITAYEQKNKELKKEKAKIRIAKEYIENNCHEFYCKRDELMELEFDNNTNATDLIDILETNW